MSYPISSDVSKKPFLTAQVTADFEREIKSGVFHPAKQAEGLTPKESTIVKDILKRFGLSLSENSLTYDKKPTWNSLPRDLRLRLDSNNPDTDRGGNVSIDSHDKTIKAYVFSNFVEEKAEFFGVSKNEMERYVALQEVGGKELLSKGSVVTQNAEVVTEAMSAKLNPQLAYLTVLPYIIDIGRGENPPDKYRLMAQIGMDASGSVMQKYEIGRGSFKERGSQFTRLAAQHVKQEVAKGNENFRNIYDTFIVKLASMSGNKVTPEKLNQELFTAYEKALDFAARP
jgi:hypothetical protein